MGMEYGSHWGGYNSLQLYCRMETVVDQTVVDQKKKGDAVLSTIAINS